MKHLLFQHFVSLTEKRYLLGIADILTFGEMQNLILILDSFRMLAGSTLFYNEYI